MMLLWMLAGPALAADAPAEPGFLDALYGEERVILGRVSPFAVDDEGNEASGEPWLENRLRVGLAGAAGDALITMEGDLFHGMILGEPYQEIDERARSAVGPEGFRPREASVKLRPGPELELGLVTSQWGLGMLANDGAQDPWFGRADFGDRVLRARLTTPAFGADDLFFSVAADRVIADDLGVMMEGQAAWQGILSLLKAGPDGARSGLYVVYRHQTEIAEQRYTRVAVADGYLDRRWDAGAGSLRAAAEVAGIIGNTDRATTYTSPQLVGVRAWGATGLLRYETERWALTGRTGAASADDNPDDGLTGDFPIDRDFDVGMVLFDEVLGRVEAATYDLLSDPDNAGQPPDGVEVLVTEGSFRRAIFAQPIVDITPTSWLLLRLGATASWSLAPYSQAFYTYRNGGVPTNHLGVATEGRRLGTELDWAIGLEERQELTAIRPGLLVQGGHLFLGPPLSDGGSQRVDLFLLTGRLRW